MLVSFPLKSNVWISLLDSRSPSFMCLLERLSRLLFLHPLLIVFNSIGLFVCWFFDSLHGLFAKEEMDSNRESKTEAWGLHQDSNVSFPSLHVIWSTRDIFKCNRKVTYKWFWVSKSELVQRQRKYLCHPLPSSSGGEKLESIQDGSARASLFGFNWSAEQLGGYPGQSASIPCRKSSGKLGKRSKISGRLF